MESKSKLFWEKYIIILEYGVRVGMEDAVGHQSKIWKNILENSEYKIWYKSQWQSQEGHHIQD